MVFPIPQPLTLSVWLFQVNIIKSLIPMSLIAKGLARGSVFSWSDEVGEHQILPRIHKGIVSVCLRTDETAFRILFFFLVAVF